MLITSPFTVFVSLIVLGLVAVGGAKYVVRRAQHQRDHIRSTYVVQFPREVKPEWVLNFVRSLSGLHTSTFTRLTSGAPTLVFEVQADIQGITHRLSVPYDPTGFVIGQLRSHVHGVRVTPIEKEPPVQATKVAELGMKNAHLPLSIISPEVVVATLLSSLHPLDKDESVLLSWVVAPAAHVAPPQKTQTRKRPFGLPIELSDQASKEHVAKSADQRFLAVGRIAARASTKRQADKLITRVRHALATTHNHQASFVVRSWQRSSTLTELAETRSVVWPLPCVLTATELATVAAWPVGIPQVPGLPAGSTRHLPADPLIPMPGPGLITVANSNWPGAERPLAIKARDMTLHMQICGMTGVGKSTLAEHMFVQTMQQGLGGAFIDPHGDAVLGGLLGGVPADRIRDVVLIDLGKNSGNAVGFNPLAGDPYQATSLVMGVFDKLFDIGKLAQTSDVMRNTLLLLAHNGLTLLDIPAVLDPQADGPTYRKQLLNRVPDKAVQTFFQRDYEPLKPDRKIEIIAPVLRRIRVFETWPALRGSLAQTKSGFDFDDILRTNKIVLLNLSKGQIGDEASQLYGSLFLSSFWSAVQRRGALAPERRAPYWLYIDEFQNYVNLPLSFSTVLAESRKYGLCFVCLHQHQAQLPFDLREAMSNARNRVIFQVGTSDASALAREFPSLKPEDFINLGQYEAIVRLMVDNRPTAPATVQTIAPGSSSGGAGASGASGRPSGPSGQGAPGTGNVDAVRRASEARYGRPIAQVEHELEERHIVPRSGPRRLTHREEDNPEDETGTSWAS